MKLSIFLLALIFSANSFSLTSRKQRDQDWMLTKEEQARLTDDTSVRCIPWNMLQDPYYTNYKTCHLAGGSVYQVLDWETEYFKRNRLNNKSVENSFRNELNF